MIRMGTAEAFARSEQTYSMVLLWKSVLDQREFECMVCYFPVEVTSPFTHSFSLAEFATLQNEAKTSKANPNHWEDYPRSTELD